MHSLYLCVCLCFPCTLFLSRGTLCQVPGIWFSFRQWSGRRMEIRVSTMTETGFWISRLSISHAFQTSNSNAVPAGWSVITSDPLWWCVPIVISPMKLPCLTRPTGCLLHTVATHQHCCPALRPPLRLASTAPLDPSCPQHAETLHWNFRCA